jgi:hypothetical protein
MDVSRSNAAMPLYVDMRKRKRMILIIYIIQRLPSIMKVL